MDREIRNIFTENPDYEQWQMLSHFAYTLNIKKFFDERNIKIANDTILDTIAGSIMQSQEYFSASKVASLNISPLLLYYGVTNLLFGICSLISGNLLDIKGHGMDLKFDTSKPKMISEVLFETYNKGDGALAQFYKVLSKNSDQPFGDSWSMSEILGSIPELKSDFESCYSEAIPHIIPIQMVKRKDSYLERINPTDIQRFKVPDALFSNINDFNTTYLAPQYSPQIDYIILRKRLGAKDIGVFSVSGQKYLQLAHLKGKRTITLPTIIYMYMGLFILGFLSRYHPGIWHPFVTKDTTGEKQIVDKFINIIRRALPNLALNALYNYEFHFVNDNQAILDLSQTTSESELKETIQDELHNFMKKNKLLKGDK